MADIRTRALQVFREGRMTIKVVSHGGAHVEAEVESSRDNMPPYVVERHLREGMWSCTCLPWMRDQATDCPHLAAVQMATGHPSAARLPVKGAEWNKCSYDHFVIVGEPVRHAGRTFCSDWCRDQWVEREAARAS